MALRRPAGGGPAVAAALAALAAAVYWPVRTFPFVNVDDQLYVYENAWVRQGLGWAGVRHAFTSLEASNWHPLTWLSHLADVQLFGLQAGGHHVTSVALHAAAAVLLFTLLLRLTGAAGRSALVAAVFAVHPLRVESVAWVSERKDVLSAVLFLATLHLWTSWVRRPSPGRYAAALAAFAAGLMAKPMLVTLPFVLLLLDVWPLARLAPAGAPTSGRLGGAGRLVAEKLPFLALSAASSAVTWLAQSGGGATRELMGVSLADRLANALLSWVAYLRLTLWPEGLAFHYPHPAAAGELPLVAVLAAGSVLAGLSALALRERLRRPWLAVGWGWFLGMLVPVIGLVQVGGQARADRYVYLPQIGLLVALVWGAAELADRVRLPVAARGALAAAVVVGLGFAARAQVWTWRDSTALHQRALAVTERNWKAWVGLADALSDAGRHPEALAAADQALRIDPGLAQAWGSLGATRGRLGEPAAAVPLLEQAVALWPEYADAWYNLGTAHGALGEHAQAARCFREAVRLRPTDARAWGNLAVASLLLGDTGWARAAVGRLRPLDPAQAAQLDAAIARAAGNAAP